MKKGSKIVAMALCSMMLFSACGSKQDETVETSVTEPVGKSAEITTVTKSMIETEYVYSGKAKPINEINVSAKVSGTVDTVNYDIGDTVEEGAVLFQIDTTDIVNTINVARSSLQSAEAGIASAQTGIEQVNGASMQQQIESAKSSLSNAELNYNNVKTTYENDKILYESGVISKTDFENSELKYNTAQLTYEQAKTNYDIIANQMPEDNLKRAQDALRSAQASRASALASIKQAEQSLTYATVRSPISGVVTACNAKAGEILGAGTVPFTIMDMSSVKFEVGVAEQIVNKMSPGHNVDILVSAVSETPLTGTILTVNPAANQTGTYTVEIQVANNDGKIKAGMFGEVHFTNEKNESAIVLPRDTVISKNGETYVFVAVGGAAKKVPVTLGIDNGKEVEITSGIAENDDVVTKGQTYLEDGDPLAIVNSTKGE